MSTAQVKRLRQLIACLTQAPATQERERLVREARRRLVAAETDELAASGWRPHFEQSPEAAVEAEFAGLLVRR